MKFKTIYKMADVGPDVMDIKDYNRLTTIHREMLPHWVSYRHHENYGVILYVEQNKKELKVMVEEMRKNRWGEKLIKLMQSASRQGIEWLMVDRDTQN